jgi:hypothetical protein
MLVCGLGWGPTPESEDVQEWGYVRMGIWDSWRGRGAQVREAEQVGGPGVGGGQVLGLGRVDRVFGHALAGVGEMRPQNAFHTLDSQGWRLTSGTD